MIIRTSRFVLVSALVLTCCLAAAEVGRRVLDGYRVWGRDLVKDPDSVDLTGSETRAAGGPPVEALLGAIARDREADVAWFVSRPQPVSGVSPRWAERRRAAFDPEANYVWNMAALADPSPQAFLREHQDRLEEILTFRSPDGGRHPFYRLFPSIETGFGFTNQFGWRGRPIDREKPPNVVRIGVLGDSTTFGYPSLLEHWLNLWAVPRGAGVRFEVINAARPSSGALDAAAILDFELAAVDIDYLIVYGFGNGISFADNLVTLPPGIVRGRPPSRSNVLDAAAGRIGRLLEPAARWSAAARFLQTRVQRRRRGTLSPEPAKPGARIAFPAGIDEDVPDPERVAEHAGNGLMLLDQYIQALNRIDAIARSRGIRLFVSTFRVLAFEGMQLATGDADNGGLIYDNLNDGPWWPYTYAQIHRLMDFYNRTVQAWAEARGHRIIPVNEQMPSIPALYRDAIHERPTGEALHAWIVLQQLMPDIRRDLAAHHLPRVGPAPRPDLDAYWQVERTRVASVVNVASLAPRRIDEGTKLPEEIPPAPVESMEEVTGAFALTKLDKAYAAAEVIRGDVPVIRTAPEPSAYAASVPAEAVGLAGKGRVRARVKVRDGRVSIGVLDKSAQRFLSIVSVDASRDMQDVLLPVDDLADVGSLMISNDRAGETAPSVLELYNVALQRPVIPRAGFRVSAVEPSSRAASAGRPHRLPAHR